MLSLHSDAEKKEAIKTIFGSGATPESATLLASFGGTLEAAQARILGTNISTTSTSGGGGDGTIITHVSCTLSGQTVNHGESITAYSEQTIGAFATYACTDRQQSRTCNEGVLSGDAGYQYPSCVKGTPNNCSAVASYTYNGHTYSIPELNHGSGTTNLISTPVSENNGTFTYTLSTIECNDGNYASVNENAAPTLVSCATDYHSADSSSCTSNTKSVSCTQTG